MLKEKQDVNDKVALYNKWKHSQMQVIHNFVKQVVHWSYQRLKSLKQKKNCTARKLKPSSNKERDTSTYSVVSKYGTCPKVLLQIGE